VPVLYRHPETGEGWSGRGKPKDITADKNSPRVQGAVRRRARQFKQAYKVA
jgi:hypothetical protein